MKSKIDLSETDTFDVMIGLLDLLETFKVESAADLHNEIEIDYCCRYCDEHTNICGCNDDDSRRRYDEYDDGDSFED